MALERELKLVAPAGLQLPERWPAAGLEAVRDGAVTLLAIYYDTPERTLVRWGCTLRHRSDEGWMVKLPAGWKSSRLDRWEVRFEGAPGSPPEPARDLVRAFARGRPLERAGELRTERERVRLVGPGGATAIEVVNDSVEVLDGDRVRERFHEVEIELAEGTDPALADPIVDLLRGRGARVEKPLPKLVRALLDDVEPELPALELGRRSRAGDLVRRALADAAERLVLHDAGLRRGRDPEDVHQARVATRRLRSNLRTFAPLVDADYARRLRVPLRALGRLLGAVRDPEVLRDRLRSRLPELPAAERDDAGALLERLELAREDARRALLECLRGPAYVELLDTLVAGAREPALTPRAARPASDVLPALVAARWRRLARAVDRLSRPPRSEELHRVRIRAKRTRYAAEAAEAVMKKPARAFAVEMRRIQDVLGEHQDAVVASRWLCEAARHATARQAFAAGHLSALEERAARDARARWTATWKRASKGTLRRWL